MSGNLAARLGALAMGAVLMAGTLRRSGQSRSPRMADPF
jgi:hypothetical protein